MSSLPLRELAIPNYDVPFLHATRAIEVIFKEPIVFIRSALGLFLLKASRKLSPSYHVCGSMKANSVQHFLCLIKGILDSFLRSRKQ